MPVEMTDSAKQRRREALSTGELKLRDMKFTSQPPQQKGRSVITDVSQNLSAAERARRQASKTIKSKK